MDGEARVHCTNTHTHHCHHHIRNLNVYQLKINNTLDLDLVVQACNPSYSEGRDRWIAHSMNDILGYRMR